MTHSEQQAHPKQSNIEFEEFGQVEIAGHLYTLYCCLTCGGMIAGHAKKRHSDWHSSANFKAQFGWGGQI